MAIAVVALALLGLSLSLPARGQAASAPSPSFRCAPKTLIPPNACGTPYRHVVEPQGQCEVWWSPEPTPTGPAWNIDRRCCLTRYCGLPDIDAGAIVRRIATHASGVLVGMNEEASRLGIKPANEQERYEYALLRWKACEDARINVAIMVEPAASAPIVPDGWCGAAPMPPAPPPWVATYAVKPNPSAADLTRPIVALLADGTLGSKVLGRATPGTDCDTRQPVRQSSGTDLYATPNGRPPGEVALCAKKP
jgi:hypothetical protein